MADANPQTNEGEQEGNQENNSSQQPSVKVRKNVLIYHFVVCTSIGHTLE